MESSNFQWQKYHPFLIQFLEASWNELRAPACLGASPSQVRVYNIQQQVTYKVLSMLYCVNIYWKWYLNHIASPHFVYSLVVVFYMITWCDFQWQKYHPFPLQFLQASWNELRAPACLGASLSQVCVYNIQQQVTYKVLSMLCRLYCVNIYWKWYLHHIAIYKNG